MKKILLNLFLITCVSCSILDTDSVEEGRRFSFGTDSHAEKIISHKDGGYVIAGITRENHSFNTPSQPFLRKESKNEKEQWTKTYPIPTNSKGIDLIKSSDDNFVFAGTVIPDSVNGNIPRNFLIFKVDNNGELLWETEIDENYIDDLSAITQLNNGAFFVSGNTTLDSGDTYPFIAKLNMEGDVLFEKALISRKNQKIYGITEFPNQNVLLYGEELKQNSDSTSALIINIDQQGNINWEKRISMSYQQQLKTNLNLKDGIILGGSKATNFSSDEGWSFSCWIIKIDFEGQVIWDNTVGGTKANEILATNHEEFIIIGNGYREGGPTNFPGGDIYAAKVDNTGNLIWSEYYDNTRFDKGNSAIQISTNTYRVVGEARVDPGKAEILIVDIHK